MGGSSINDGRVEYCEHNIWRTVCDDEWDMNEALVVCKEVGQHSGCKYIIAELISIQFTLRCTASV